MAQTQRLVWDPVGEHYYETGTDRGVLFVRGDDGSYGTGVAWNGLTGVNQSPSGAESTPLYANNKKYLNLISDEDFGFTISAYQSPEEFDVCDGQAELVKGVTASQQERKTFGLAYRTLIGNDTKGTNFGYKIHLVYGATASPSSKEYKTVNQDKEAMELSWECTTIPVESAKLNKPTAHITIDSTKVSKENLKKLEDCLYGSETAASKLPSIEELVAMFPTSSGV